MTDSPVSGTLHVLILFEVADEIRLQTVCGILGLPRAKGRMVRGPAPNYVQVSEPPVLEAFASTEGLPSGITSGAFKYYDYGVIGVELKIPFTGTWDEWIALTSRWIAEPSLEQSISALVTERLSRLAKALVKPYAAHLAEDYYVVHLPPLSFTGAELLALHGPTLAQVVRGERLPLSPEECNEILAARLSYYATDLIIVGWTAALIYDTEEEARSAIQLLEYANSQLLEFRHYDEVLTPHLDRVYKSLEKPRRFPGNWRLRGEAERLNKIRLEVQELTERVDNSVKFLSDMFSARLYKLAEARVGVPDYRKLVDEKLRIAGDLYHFMVEQYNHTRAFVLESMVVIILIIDLIYLFRGKA